MMQKNSRVCEVLSGLDEFMYLCESAKKTEMNGPARPLTMECAQYVTMMRALACGFKMV